MGKFKFSWVLVKFLSEDVIIIMVVRTPLYMCWGAFDHNDSHLIVCHEVVDALFLERISLNRTHEDGQDNLSRSGSVVASWYQKSLINH